MHLDVLYLCFKFIYFNLSRKKWKKSGLKNYFCDKALGRTIFFIFGHVVETQLEPRSDQLLWYDSVGMSHFVAIGDSLFVCRVTSIRTCTLQLAEHDKRSTQSLTQTALQIVRGRLTAHTNSSQKLL